MRNDIGWEMKGDVWDHLGMEQAEKRGCLWCLTLGLRSNPGGDRREAKRSTGPRVKQRNQKVEHRLTQCPQMPPITAIQSLLLWVTPVTNEPFYLGPPHQGSRRAQNMSHTLVLLFL